VIKLKCIATKYVYCDGKLGARGDKLNEFKMKVNFLFSLNSL